MYSKTTKSCPGQMPLFFLNKLFIIDRPGVAGAVDFEPGSPPRTKQLLKGSIAKIH